MKMLSIIYCSKCRDCVFRNFGLFDEKKMFKCSHGKFHLRPMIPSLIEKVSECPKYQKK